MNNSPTLNKEFKKQLVIRSQKLKPVVILGNQGLSPNVLKEIDNALTAHELIKVRINAADREERQALINEIILSSHAHLIQAIGHVISIYRQKEKGSK